MITVERIDDDEVSPYLAGELGVGDMIELRGPIGGYFVWEPSDGGPLVLIAGGSGICPLMTMIRLRADTGSSVPTRLLYPSRSLEDVIYRDEHDRQASEGDELEVIHTLTRSRPPDWRGHRRRIDAAMLGEGVWSPQQVSCRGCSPVRSPRRVVPACRAGGSRSSARSTCTCMPARAHGAVLR